MIDHRRGMTLIEMTTALVITGMMAMTGASAFSSIIDRHHAIVQATAATERAAALRETIRDWLISGRIQTTSGGVPRGTTGAGRGGGGAQMTTAIATVTPGGNSTGTVGVTSATAAGDELDFTTVAPNPSFAPQAQMRLFIDGDASTPETGLTLEYQSSTQAPLQRKMLDSTIASITVEFLDRRTGQWYPASQAATIQPWALRVTLTATDSLHAPGILSLPMVIAIGAPATFSGSGTIR